MTATKLELPTPTPEQWAEAEPADLPASPWTAGPFRVNVLRGHPSSPTEITLTVSAPFDAIAGVIADGERRFVELQNRVRAEAEALPEVTAWRAAHKRQVEVEARLALLRGQIDMAKKSAADGLAPGDGVIDYAALDDQAKTIGQARESIVPLEAALPGLCHATQEAAVAAHRAIRALMLQATEAAAAEVEHEERSAGNIGEQARAALDAIVSAAVFAALVRGASINDHAAATAIIGPIPIVPVPEPTPRLTGIVPYEMLAACGFGMNAMGGAS